MTTTSDSLLCVQFTLPSPAPLLEEEFEYALWEGEIEGLQREDEETFSNLVEDPRPRPAGSVRWRTFLDTDAADAEVAARFEQIVTDYPGIEMELWRLDDLSFMTAWKAFFKPTQVSPRIWIHPPWEQAGSEGTISVEIEPGMAFGTGTHETTRLCLRHVDRWAQQGVGERLLDVGTGSAILAIAAAKLGVPTIYGVDHDPDAIQVARENLEINDVTSAVKVSTQPIAEVEGQWDLVIANILPNILATMVPALWARVRPGGQLLLSGILVHEVERMRGLFDRPDAPEPRLEVDGEWTSLLYTLPEATA